MISIITGRIIHAEPRYLVVDVNGVGYKIFTTAGVLETTSGMLKANHGKDFDAEKTTFWTHLAVRENSLDLYGFLSKEEMDIFDSLLSVSGIGPKTALGILNVANVATIRRAVLTEDPSYLTKVAGVGKKNAEKIVLELKGKFSEMEDVDGAAELGESDALDALKALGYGEREARDALKNVPMEIINTGERVKAALKMLSSGK
jgi:Holliday junction DNA helicase RuvA